MSLEQGECGDLCRVTVFHGKYQLCLLSGKEMRCMGFVPEATLFLWHLFVCLQHRVESYPMSRSGGKLVKADRLTSPVMGNLSGLSMTT